jgi:hypothetical protein
MSNRYRLFVLTLFAAGVVISIFPDTVLFAFNSCTEAHKCLLFGFSFAPFGNAFFILAGLIVSLINRLPGAALFSIRPWQAWPALKSM